MSAWFNREMTPAKIAVLLTVWHVALCDGSALNRDNFSELARERATFIKFFAPWCGHCKAMAPAWDALTADFKDSTELFVGECDCTGDCKSLCESVGVQGYPTIKYGEPSMLQDYKGQRDYETMKSHALTNIKLSCSPSRRDLCTDEQQTEMDDIMAMDEAAVRAAIKEREDKVAEVEMEFQTAVESLQKQYKQMMETKEQKTSALQDHRLRWMKIAATGASNV